MKKLAFLCSWTLALLSVGPFDPGWTHVSKGLVGSVPGVNQLVIDRATGTTFYALTSGGLFKSTNGGSIWTVLGNIVGVNFIALDPTSPSIVYAGTANGVSKSTDGGESWASTGLAGTPIGVLAIDPITPSMLYAGSGSHLYKSMDRGGNWTDLNLEPPGAVAALVLDPSTPSTLYVALGQGAGGDLIKSVDGGATWSVIYANAGPFYGPPFFSNLVIDPSNPSTLYRTNPLQKSTDGGQSWTPIAFPVTKAYLVTALAVDSRNSNTLYVSSTGSTGHAIYKSTDGGQSWNVLDTIIPATGSLVFSPDSSTIYAATGSGVFKSTDGGLNWGEAQSGLSVFDIEVLVGDPVNADTIYAGGNDGLFKSLNSAGSWTQFSFPAAASSLLIDFTNSNILYARKANPTGCPSGEIDLYKSTDGGSVWSDLEPDPYHGCGDGGTMAMDPVDPNTLYVVYGNDYDGFTIFKTTDGGANWQDFAFVLAQASWVNALLIDRNTPTTLYAATDVGVLRSTDGGASFLPTGLANTPVAFLAIDPVHPNVFYAATSNNPYSNQLGLAPPGLVGLYKSTDSGATWSAINQGLDEIVAAHPTVRALLVDADNPNTLYLATSGYGVFRSTDGGATWAPFNNGLTHLDVDSLTLVHGSPRGSHRGRSSAFGSYTLYAGTPAGVFKLEQPGR